jgi:hypothetical protein
VDWDEHLNQAVPKAPVIFKEKPPVLTIPVIFITNRTIQNISAADIPALASTILQKVASLNASYGLEYKEIQIDCDWTERSSQKYFQLLKTFKQIESNSTCISATIRLHQIKFSRRTGVPPVQKGVLMVYNIAPLNEINTLNSVFDPAIISKYTDQLNDYPLPLDLALPVFRQNILFRNKHFITVMRDNNYFEPHNLEKHFKSIGNNQFQCIRDTLIKNIFIQNDDIIRNEISDLEEIKRTSKIMQRQLKNTTFTIILFDLNSNHIKNKSIEEIKSIFPQQ